MIEHAPTVLIADVVGAQTAATVSKPMVDRGEGDYTWIE